jgi:prepilin-type N-terminal cleavage/methylation domain-containing protein
MSRGYTLIEMLVVLVLMGLAAALVAPTLMPSRAPSDEVLALIAQARSTGVRRAETVTLTLEASGAWRLNGAASRAAGAIAAGRLSRLQTALTLVFSPLGSCGADVATAAAAEALRIDPLTCAPAAP